MELEMKIRGLMMDPVTNMPIVVLKDVQGSAVLPIWVGVYEANAIALEIEKVQTPRPMTHDLLKNVFLGFDVRVDKIVVNDLKDDIVLRADLCGARRPDDDHRLAAERSRWRWLCAWIARSSWMSTVLKNSKVFQRAYRTHHQRNNCATG
jgi:bifunctional DNase/RNase